MKKITYYLLFFAFFCSVIFSPLTAHADADDLSNFLKKIDAANSYNNPSDREIFIEAYRVAAERGLDSQGAIAAANAAVEASKKSTTNSLFIIDIKEEKLSLNIDDSVWYVFTRDNVYSNPEVDELGLSADTLYEAYLKDDIYLNAAVFFRWHFEKSEKIF